MRDKRLCFSLPATSYSLYKKSSLSKFNPRTTNAGSFWSNSDKVYHDIIFLLAMSKYSIRCLNCSNIIRKNRTGDTPISCTKSTQIIFLICISLLINLIHFILNSFVKPMYHRKVAIGSN